MRSNHAIAPFGGINTLERDLNKMFEDFFRVDRKTDHVWRPASDISETEELFRLSLDLPGLSKKDITINLEDNVLTVSGTREREEKAENTQYFRMERVWGSFERRFRLPKAVDANGIKAKFQNGVLNIEIPKAKEALPRTIEIS